jgi:hypothetical protein
MILLARKRIAEATVRCGGHRSLLAIVVGLAVFLVAAAPALTIVPTVVVYPFTAGADGIDDETLDNIANMLATRIAQGGAVRVEPPTPGVQRQKFLSDARLLHADYYVTGFITPLGSNASMVEQVVSTQSGTVVFSSSAEIGDTADVTAQGDVLREGILERSSRGIQAFEAPPAAITAPSAGNRAHVNANRPFGSKRHAARAVATPAPAAANATIAILPIGGSADARLRTATAQALLASFGQDGRHAVLVSATTPSNSVCVANKATSLADAWIDSQSSSIAPNEEASLRMVVYDCKGRIVFDHSFQYHGSSAHGGQLALTGATDAAVGAYLNQGKRRD